MRTEFNNEFLNYEDDEYVDDNDIDEESSSSRNMSVGWCRVTQFSVYCVPFPGDKIRPGIVVSNNYLNTTKKYVYMIPVTSKDKRSALNKKYGNWLIESLNENAQIATMDVSEIIKIPKRSILKSKYIGSIVDDDTKNQIVSKLYDVIDPVFNMDVLSCKNQLEKIGNNRTDDMYLHGMDSTYKNNESSSKKLTEIGFDNLSIYMELDDAYNLIREINPLNIKWTKLEASESNLKNGAKLLSYIMQNDEYIQSVLFNKKSNKNDFVKYMMKHHDDIFTQELTNKIVQDLVSRV